MEVITVDRLKLAHLDVASWHSLALGLASTEAQPTLPACISTPQQYSHNTPICCPDDDTHFDFGGEVM